MGGCLPDPIVTGSVISAVTCFTSILGGDFQWAGRCPVSVVALAGREV